MITLAFECHHCRTDSIHAVRSREEVCSLDNHIPLRLRCWACGTQYSVVQTLPQDGLRPAAEPPFKQCLKAAAACRRRATATHDVELQKFFARMESYWLRVASESEHEQGGVVIARATRRSKTEAPRRIA